MIGMLHHIARRDGSKKARPSRSRIKLRLRRKERESTACTAVDARFFVVEQHPAERTLGPLAAQDPKLIGRKLRAPRFVGFHHFIGLDWTYEGSGAIKQMNFRHGGNLSSEVSVDEWFERKSEITPIVRRESRDADSAG